MEDSLLKKYLIQIAENLTAKSTLEDVYAQLSLLADIDESEEDEKIGNILSQQEVQVLSKQWLK